MNPSPKLVLAFVLTVLGAAAITVHNYWTVRAPEPIVPAWAEPAGLEAEGGEGVCPTCDVARQSRGEPTDAEPI